jgi:hypothetical protein
MSEKYYMAMIEAYVNRNWWLSRHEKTGSLAAKKIAEEYHAIARQAEFMYQISTQ